MQVVIVGAGPVGLLQCLFLLKNCRNLESKYGSMDICVFEKRREADLVDETQQRSINLALSWRGMRALKAVDLLDDVMRAAVPMKGRCIHDGSRTHFQKYSPFPDQMIYSIQRVAIEKLLLERVKSHSGSKIQLHFQQALDRIDFEDDLAMLNFSKMTEGGGRRADLIIGCDGAFSRVREEFTRNHPARVEKATFEHRYKELQVPSAAGLLPRDHLHIWPRKKAMLIALPNSDGSFTATFFGSITHGDYQNFCAEYPDFVEAVGMDQLASNWKTSPASSLNSAQVDPIGADRIVLLGDAGHSILPFYGQGMNAGFEDVQIFTEYLCTSERLDEAIKTYSTRRVPDARAISQLAEENYVEMSRSVLSPLFRFTTKAIQILSEYFPTAIIPRYSMIAFTSIPYGDIKKRERRQELKAIVVVLSMLLLGYISWE